MKFKALAASFLACAGLAACGAPTAEEAAADRAEAASTAFDVKCYDPSGNLTFEGASEYGLQSYREPHAEVVTLDGRAYEQYGGYCTATKRVPGRQP